MNPIERRALYNLVRMNWLNEPTLAVEPWQVEDYRDLPLSTLFERLEKFNISLNRPSFVAYADECESPEDLTDHLIGDLDLKASQEDQIYLLVFELWRRIMSEKPSISILCNELDYQIHLFDTEQLENPMALHDSLLQFLEILDENVDEGIEPQEAFALISNFCANDIETFLYDFISQQIDEGNESYAHELLDSFDAYLSENKWFKLLRIQLSGHAHSKVTQKIIDQVIEEHIEENDLEYNLELLALLSDIGDPATFRTMIDLTLPLITVEEDFQDLLSIALDYFHRMDHDQHAIDIQRLLDKRLHIPLDQQVDPHDPDRTAIANFFH